MTGRRPGGRPALSGVGVRARPGRCTVAGMRSAVVVALAMVLVGGCDRGRKAPAPTLWMITGAACTTTAHTDGPVPDGAAPGCGRTLAGDGTLDQAYGLGLCGPCAFIYDDGITRSERARGRGEACCYRGESPPPPEGW